MQKNILTYCTIVLVMLCGMGLAQDTGTETPRLLFQQTFREKPGDAWSGMGQAHVTFEQSGTDVAVMKIMRTESQGVGSISVATELPPDAFCAKRVRVAARIKAEKVSQPPNPWNGIKCMLHVISPGGDKWLQKDNLTGTFDWQDVEFIANIPPDTTRVQLILGLENVTGTAWFDEITIREISTMRKSPGDIDPALAATPVYKGHEKTRLRGAMIGTSVAEQDIRVLGGDWGANHIRWQLLWGGFPNGPADTATIQQYRDWLEREYKRLEQLLPICEELGMLIVIDLHTPPGGRDRESNMPLFQKKELQDEFLHTWEVIATRFKGNKAVWAYDLLNEACEGKVADGLMNWQELATAAAKRIRTIDAERAIIVEPAPWGSPDSLDWFEPLEGVSNVVYSVHMYMPHKFTHQGVGNETKPLTYPGEIDGVYWDKDRLRKALEPVFRFQRDNHVHIYLGEFSAIRWAPGDSAYNYLKDCIEIFEESDWDWAYHAFREWAGWSVEHVGPPDATQHAESPTDRQLLLMEYFRKGRQPQESEWEPLFNGKDLAGWHVACQPQDSEKVFWTVEDGTILCDSLGRKDHNYVWLTTDREFQDFELRLKFQVYSDSPGNSGLQFRSRYDKTDGNGWLNGPQIDIHPLKDSMPWRTGLVYDETKGVNRWIYPSLKDSAMQSEYEPQEHVMKHAEDGDGWNEMILICKGMQIKTIVNGIVRADWDATGVLDSELHRKHNVGQKGHFALQLHNGDELRIKFKDIEIKEISP